MNDGNTLHLERTEISDIEENSIEQRSVVARYKDQFKRNKIPAQIDSVRVRESMQYFLFV